MTSIGDSLTVQYANTFDRFQHAFNQAGFPADVHALGISGINSTGYASPTNLDPALATAPDVVVINLGANDSAQWVVNPEKDNLAIFAANMTVIFAAFLSLPNPPLLLISTVLPFAPYDPQDTTRHTMQLAVDNEINPWLRQRAPEVGILIDYNEQFKTKPGWGASFYIDAVHLTAEMANAMARDYRDYVITSLAVLP